MTDWNNLEKASASNRTWANIITTWATDDRTWAEMAVAVWTNISKNSSTFTNITKNGGTTWAGIATTWAAETLTWDQMASAPWTNLSKS